MNKFFPLQKIVLGTVYLFTLLPAVAQQGSDIETVANRSREALDPFGIRIGNSILSPDVSVEALYKDNVFAGETVLVEDSVVSVNPTLTLESDWNIHSFGLIAEANSGRYEKNVSEDYNDFFFQAEGRLDVSRASYFEAYAQHAIDHQDRTSSEDVEGSSLTTYWTDSASLSYYLQPNRAFFRMEFLARETDYNDARTWNDVVNNDDRDLTHVQQSLSVGYELSSGAALFLRGTINDRKYRDEIDDAGFQRSSSGYEVVLGASRDISGVSSADIYVGYRVQEFDDTRYETIDGVSFGANLTWNMTNLITLNAEAGNTIEATTILGASSIDSWRYGVSIDYELLRRLIVSASILAIDENFEGLSRQDRIRRSGLSARFMLNRYLYAFVGYNFESQESQPPDFGVDNYELNTYFIRLQGQL